MSRSSCGARGSLIEGTLPGKMLQKAIDRTMGDDDDSGKVNILAGPADSKHATTSAARFCWHKTRFLIMLLSTACLSAIMANSLALNFTVICMVDDERRNDQRMDELLTRAAENATAQPEEKPSLFTEAQQSWLFSAIAIGTIVGTAPISYLSGRFGIRRSFAAYGMISALSTLLLPWAVSGGFVYVFLARVLQGFSVATSFPAMGSIISEWSTTRRSGIYIAFISIHLQMGSVITMPMAGELCASRFGWPMVYYILGVATFVLFVLFFAFYRDSAARHRCVSPRELTIIQRDKPHMNKTGAKEPAPVVPWRALFTDLPVLGCILSCFSSNLGYNVFIQFGPVYLNKVLDFDVKKTGFIAAAPAIICIFVKFIAGPISDSLPCSARWRIIVFATVSQCCMGLCFIALAFLPPGSSTLAQAFFTGAIVFSGLNCVGVIKSCQLISGRFAYLIMATHSFTNSCIVLVLPLIIAYVAPDNTREQWARILIFVAALVIVAILFFDFTCEASPRPWALTHTCTYEQSAKTAGNKEQNIAQAVRTLTIDDLVLGNEKMDEKEEDRKQAHELV